MSSPEDSLPSESLSSINGITITPFSASGLSIPGNVGNISFNIMSDFQGKKNHCGPTAGLNMLRYYDRSGQVPGLFAKEATVLFNTLYANMRTNQPLGTLSGSFVSGMKNTLSGLGTINYNAYTTSNDWSNYKFMINNCYPVAMMFYLDNWCDYTYGLVDPNWAWHWVMGTAWLEDKVNSSYTLNYVYAIDGWNRNVVYRSVGYNNKAPADVLVFVNVGY